MKKNYFLIIMVVLFALSINTNVAQNIVVKQVIVGSGGIFGDTTNSVSLAAFNPNTDVTSTFGSINTQSIQDIVINGNYAFIAAQDSIAKFDLDTYQKLSTVSAPGVNRLLVVGDVLFASFQYPATENFVKVFATTDLTLINAVADVSDEAAGMLVAGSFLYAAVPGGWASTVGKIAIISLNDYSLVDEINFNEAGVGIYDLFYHNDLIMSVNRTAWGGTSSNLLAMNALGIDTFVYPIGATIGKMVGIVDNQLFTVMNSGIGAIDLTDMSISDTAFIAAPALTIADAAIDTLSGSFYVTTTDYFSTGVGTIYDALGVETGNFDAGISPDAIAIDYRDNTGIFDANANNDNFVIYPNPAINIINIALDNQDVNKYSIVDISGRVLLHNNFTDKNTAVDVSSLNSGMYFMVLSGKSGTFSKSFIVK